MNLVWIGSDVLYILFKIRFSSVLISNFIFVIFICSQIPTALRSFQLNLMRNFFKHELLLNNQIDDKYYIPKLWCSRLLNCLNELSVEEYYVGYSRIQFSISIWHLVYIYKWFQFFDLGCIRVFVQLMKFCMYRFRLCRRSVQITSNSFFVHCNQ